MNDTITAILDERGKRYNLHGTYADHASLTQDLKNRMRVHPGWKHLPQDMQETLDMMMHKVARIINGDPTYRDNWDDIQGYVQLVSKDLK